MAATRCDVDRHAKVQLRPKRQEAAIHGAFMAKQPLRPFDQTIVQSTQPPSTTASSPSEASVPSHSTQMQSHASQEQPLPVSNPFQHHRRRRQSHDPRTAAQKALEAPRRYSQHQPRASPRVTFERPRQPSGHALATNNPSVQGAQDASVLFPSDCDLQARPRQAISAIDGLQPVPVQRLKSSPEPLQTNGTSVLPESQPTQTYVELSRVRRREIIGRVNDSVQAVMASMLSDKSKHVQWKPKLRKKDISYFTDEGTVKLGQTRFCCVTHTHATVDEIMKLFVVAEDEKMQRNNRVLSDNLLEARILSVLRRPTKERPMNSIYIRYACYQTPGLMMNRKVCLVVATDTIRQPDGSMIGYCLWDSIDDSEFAEARNQPNLPSCTMFRSGFFLRRSGRAASLKTDSRSTKIVYMIGLEYGGWVPGFTARLLMEKFGDNLTRLCSHFRRKQLDSRTFVMKTQWESKVAAKSCHECKKLFHVLSTRVNCHACGHVVCRACATKEQVELHAVGLVPMHICFTCLKKAGLPIPLFLQKTTGAPRRRRLQSETAATSRPTTQVLAPPPPLPRSKSVIQRDFIEDDDVKDDDDDTDTGEWAFTASGKPFRPNRIERGDKS